MDLKDGKLSIMLYILNILGHSNMCNDIRCDEHNQLIDDAQCYYPGLLILNMFSQFHFSHPYLLRGVDGKVMTPLQQGIPLFV